MKTSTFCFCLFFVIALDAQQLIFLDGVKAVFRGSHGTDLVMASELERPKLDGSPTNLQEILNELALAQEAKKYRLWPSPEEVEKQLRMVAQSNKKTPKELDELFIATGYTPQEGMNSFAQINAVNSLVGFKITANLIVPESEVIAYYNENPEYEPAAYHIEHTIIPFATNKEQQLKQLQAVVRTNDAKHSLAWEASFWINQDDLAADKQFITQLKVGQISQPQEVYGGFELFRLVNMHEARLKPLDERYGQIVTLLRKPKYGELMAQFQKELLDSASIILFDVP